MAEKSIQEPGGEIAIYKDSDGPEVRVKLEGETVWLSQSDIANLFGVNKPAISKHISNIYKDKELRPESTVSKMETVQSEGGRFIKRNIEFYNLDMVISVGYRVNSKRATQFRIWATQRLRDYLIKGFVVNQERLSRESRARLKELETAVVLLQGVIESRRLEGYEKELLSIITDYTKTWVLLNQYDEGEVRPETLTKKSTGSLDYGKAKDIVDQFKTRLLKAGQASDLFGKEVGHKFKALLGNIDQTFDGQQLYTSLEEKAAHLLYFAIKDHPFADGNKRIGSLLFLLYLVENHRVYNRRGERLVSDSTLTVLAVLIAESKPDHKEVMVKLVASLLTKK